MSNNETETDVATLPESGSPSTVAFLGSEEVREFLRYFVASTVALVVDVVTLYLLTSSAGLLYLYSGAVAFMLGLTTVYLLSILWVFRKRALSDWRAEFVLFAAIGLVGLGLNELILWLLTGHLGLFYLVSKAASVFVVFSWNFGARKWLLFREG